MNVYLAARYSRREELAGYIPQLEELGFTVQARWLSGNHTVTDTPDGDDGTDNPEANALRAQYAQEDVDDVMSADIVISFTEPPRATHTRGGRHVEFGIAHAIGARTVVVGYRENIFHWLDDVEFYETWEEAVKNL